MPAYRLNEACGAFYSARCRTQSVETDPRDVRPLVGMPSGVHDAAYSTIRSPGKIERFDGLSVQAFNAVLLIGRGTATALTGFNPGSRPVMTASTSSGLNVSIRASLLDTPFGIIMCMLREIPLVCIVPVKCFQCPLYI